MRSKPKAWAKAQLANGNRISVKGREAQTLLALVAAGSGGISGLETFKAGWAVRLGAYIFDLRRMGVAIETTREPHDGGSHARYRLTAPVTLLSHYGEAANAKRGVAA